VHVSLGTEAAAQLKLDRFRKETTIEQNKLAIRLLKEAACGGSQFIMGLENETQETIERLIAWRRTGNRTWPTGTCTRRGPLPSCSRS